jgi:cellulose synthase/poly-beta-1,6-N-acetylglucosamine synthase-like glycosyltransferase
MAVTGPTADGYARCTALAGPAVPRRDRLAFRPLVRGRDLAVLCALFGLNVLAVAAFLTVITVLQAHAGIGPAGWAAWTLVVLSELLRLLQSTGALVFAGFARDPVPMEPVAGLRVAMLTTIVPAKEPVEMVLQTLRAMRAVAYDGVVDVWILDEGDDPAVRAAAASLGVRHFSRRGQPGYNMASGPFRAGTKAGNHNAWRERHGAGYDVVAQVDPDHVPLPAFLQRTLGYFRDPDVAFVVAPQVSGNTGANAIARAAAALGYVFTGVIQRGGNGLGAPLLIGTNHVYRMSAWEQIGGYRDSIIEDHLTGMAVHAATNPDTGARWAGVYTPDVLAIGEGPSTWTDFFRQQDRWASGIWQILLGAGRPLRRRLAARQQLAYAFLQSFYPSVGIVWILGTLATMAYLAGAARAPGWEGGIALPWLAWGLVVGSWVLIFQWMKRWYLHPAERNVSILLPWLATLVTAPVYAASAMAALLGRRPAYAVTGKGRLRSTDSLRTFGPHLAWAAVLGAALGWRWAWAGALGPGPGAAGAGAVAVAWALLGLAVCLLPPAAAFLAALRNRHGRPAERRFRAVRRRTLPSHTRPAPARRQPGPRVASATAAASRGRSGTAPPR